MEMDDEVEQRHARVHHRRGIAVIAWQQQLEVGPEPAKGKLDFQLWKDHCRAAFLTSSAIPQSCAKISPPPDPNPWSDRPHPCLLVDGLAASQPHKSQGVPPPQRSLDRAHDPVVFHVGWGRRGWDSCPRSVARFEHCLLLETRKFLPATRIHQ